MDRERHDIVVTGLAAISSAGVGLAPLREALADGKSRLLPVPGEMLGESGHFWGRAKDFKAADFMSPLKARKLDRGSQFAVVATGMVLKNAGIDLEKLDRTRVGIVLGCGFGGIANSAEFLSGYFTSGAEGLEPMLFPNTVPNAAASNASIEHGLKGPNVTFVQRFCSTESALLMARRFLEDDRADIIVTGGFDELMPLMLQAFKSMGQLGRHAEGFGEGSGLMVLERRLHADRRGAGILAGTGEVRTVGRLIPGAEPEGMERLLRGCPPPALVTLSGTAARMPRIADLYPGARRLSTGPLLGHSLSMGGLAMVSHILSLPAGADGLHLAASPEGPLYAVEFTGGAPVQP